MSFTATLLSEIFFSLLLIAILTAKFEMIAKMVRNAGRLSDE